MDWTSIIAEIGGGLPAVVIAGLAWWGWRKDGQLNQANEARFQMVQKLTEVAERSTASNDKLVNVVASLADELRREGK